nr:unnamed protein product [Digitaria exilis]
MRIIVVAATEPQCPNQTCGRGNLYKSINETPDSNPGERVNQRRKIESDKISDPSEDPHRISLNLTAEDDPNRSRGTGWQNDSAKWKSGITGNEYRQLVDADGAGLGVHRFERRREASGRRRRGSVTKVVLLIEGPTPRQPNRYDCDVYIMAIARPICGWWGDKDGHGSSANWFKAVRREVDAASVTTMKTELLELINFLMEEKANA